MIFPKVTGNRLFIKKEDQVNVEVSTAAWETNDGSILTNKRPAGMMYMFATLCSKPAAMKALIGKTIAIILSIVDRPL